MDFSTMSGYEFENYVSDVLRKMDFIVEQTSYSNDGGIDIIAVYKKPLFAGKYIIQCKNWQSSVGAPEVRDLYGVVMDQRANKGILITPSDYTIQAYDFAKGKNIELINGSVLKEIAEGVLDEKKSVDKKSSLPDDFNHDRYDYLKKRIDDEPRNNRYYTEMIVFLREYLCQKESEKLNLEILDLLVMYTDTLIKKCYNTKTKVAYKTAETLNKALFLLLKGEIAKSLDIVLDKKRLRRYKTEFAYNVRVESYLGTDVLTRNFYAVFKALNYEYGIEILNELIPVVPTGGPSFEIKFDYEKERIEEYQRWEYLEEVYIPRYYVYAFAYKKKNEYVLTDIFSTKKECISIKVSMLCSMLSETARKELFEELNKVFMQHGYE